MSHSLTLYIYPSPFGVDWRSPHHLTRSVILNAASLKPRTIGHVSVKLEGPGESIFTGMSTPNMNVNRRLVLRDHWGLGVLYYAYPGMLEDEKRLEPELKSRLESGKLSFVKFKLSRESYEKAKQYFQEYLARNVGRLYGLPYRPRHGEGAGCSAFGASFLEVAGVMRDEFRKHWSDTVRLPEEYIGNPAGSGRKVPIWKLLIPSSRNTRWAKPEEPGREIFFWDPDMMHSWVMKKRNELQSPSEKDFQSLEEGRAKGILVDSSKISPSNEPIWL